MALCLAESYVWADGLEHHITSLVACCGVGENVVSDYDPYGGWYDVHRCGECHDYCFWMSDPDTVFDPTFRPGTDPWHTPSE